MVNGKYLAKQNLAHRCHQKQLRTEHHKQRNRWRSGNSRWRRTESIGMLGGNHQNWRPLRETKRPFRFKRISNAEQTSRLDEFSSGYGLWTGLPLGIITQIVNIFALINLVTALADKSRGPATLLLFFRSYCMLRSVADNLTHSDVSKEHLVRKITRHNRNVSE
jgi:hypothetical protein